MSSLSGEASSGAVKKRQLDAKDYNASESVDLKNVTESAVERRERVWTSLHTGWPGSIRGPIKSADDLDDSELRELFLIGAEKFSLQTSDGGRPSTATMESFVLEVFNNWTTDIDTADPPSVDMMPLPKSFSVALKSGRIARYHLHSSRQSSQCYGTLQ